jgi:drug/metabolite transporter (DMT)-like permease
METHPFTAPALRQPSPPPAGAAKQGWSASRALLVSVASAAFFSVVFVLNRSMAQASGHWAWSSSLRFFLMLPPLALVLTARSQWGALREAWRAAPRAWLTWGTIGFVVFYATLTAAGALAPGWMVAGTWAINIVAGLLLAPLLYTDHRRRVPRRALLASVVVVGGVVLLQLEHARAADWRTAGAGLLLVLVAAVAYPLGNRRMMLTLEERGMSATDTFVRLTAMTLGSLPAWILIALYGFAQAGPPPGGQVVQAGIVALSAGVIATWLFFAATEAVRRDPVALAGVEAAQAAEVPCALGLEMLLLGAAAPAALGWVGLGIIVAGIVAYALLTAR